MCSVYDVYSFHVIPVMGRLVAGDWKSYQYLVESIRQFPCQVVTSYVLLVALDLHCTALDQQGLLCVEPG